MEGKEIIGVVRKVVFKDKNGEKIPFPTADVEKCYLYVQYLDDYKDRKSELQTIVVEGLYYPEGSVLRLKYLERKWHLRYELKYTDPITMMTSPENYYCSSAKAGRPLNEAAREVYGNSYYGLKTEAQFLEKQKMINQQFGGVTNFRGLLDIEENFDLIADSQSIDFDRLEFIKLITGIRYFFRNKYLDIPREFWHSLHEARYEIEHGEMSLKKWISYVAVVFEYANYTTFLPRCAYQRDDDRFEEWHYSDYVGDDEKLMLEIMSKLLQTRLDTADKPIYAQMRAELEAKKDVYERKLKK